MQRDLRSSERGWGCPCFQIGPLAAITPSPIKPDLLVALEDWSWPLLFYTMMTEEYVPQIISLHETLAGSLEAAMWGIVHVLAGTVIDLNSSYRLIGRNVLHCDFIGGRGGEYAQWFVHLMTVPVELHLDPLTTSPNALAIDSF
ncbi:hypothetical protein FKM82_004343 [Ascaphus truei]